MRTYNEVAQKFADLGCVLTTSEDEFDKMNNKLKSRFEFTASCGHPNSVTLVNFIYKGTGRICKECVNKSISETFRNSSRQYFEQEYDGFVKIKGILEHDFEIMKTNEGCLSDFIIKPKYISEDKWAMIQLKTTNALCHGLYSFGIHKRNYANCIVICMCLSEDKIWILEYTHCIEKNKLNIGSTNKSEYFQYQCSSQNVVERLHFAYALQPKFNNAYPVIPINVNQQQELKYRALREKNIPWLNFNYPEVESRVFDFTINNYTIQEKVASISKETSKGKIYIANLYRTSSVNSPLKQYKRGDNDFYWVWRKNDYNVFYVIPESELIDRGYINDSSTTDKKTSFTLREWTNAFKYTLDDKQLREKLESIFGF